MGISDVIVWQCVPVMSWQLVTISQGNSYYYGMAISNAFKNVIQWRLEKFSHDNYSYQYGIIIRNVMAWK